MAANTEINLNEEMPSQLSDGDFLSFAQLIADNLRLLLIGPLIIGLITLAATFLIRPTYTASVRVMPPPQQSQGAAAAMLQSLGTLGAAVGASGGLKNPGDLYVGLLKTRYVQDALIKKFDLINRYDQEFKELARKQLADNTRIVNGKDSIIVLEIDDHEPKTAAALANAYTEALGDLLSTLSVTEAQMRRSFFEKQLAIAKANLEKAELALKAGGGLSVTALKLSPAISVGATAQIQAQVTNLEIKLVSMRGYMSDTAPEYRQINTELAALKAQLLSIENQPTTLPSNEKDYLDRYRDYKYFESLYELLTKQYEVARLDEGREGNVMQVVDTAQIPEKKSKPKKAIIATFSTIVAGFFILVFVFLRNSHRQMKKNSVTAGRLANIKSSAIAAFRKTQAL